MLPRSLVFVCTLALLTWPIPGWARPTPTPSPTALAACDNGVAAPSPATPLLPLMAVATDGTLYLMEQNESIFRFRPGARDDAEPDAQFCLSRRPRYRPVTLAATHGEVFVGALGSVSVLPATASGPVEAKRTLGDAQANPLGGLLFTNMGPYQISVGRDGTIYALSDKSCHCSAGGTEDDIDIYAPGAQGNASPMRGLSAPAYAVTENGKKTIAYAYVMAMGLDGASRLFVIADDSLVVSRPGARAPFALEAKLRIFDEPENRQLTFDDVGTAYVAQGANVIVVTGATGATPHVTKLAGPKTDITDAEGLATDASGKLFVLNCADADTSIIVFAAMAHGDVAPLYHLHGSQFGLSCPVKL